MATNLAKLNFWGSCAIAIVIIAFAGLLLGRTAQELATTYPIAAFIFFSIAVITIYKKAHPPQTIRPEIFSDSGLLVSIIFYLLFAIAIYIYVPHKIEIVHYLQFSLLPITLIFWKATDQNVVSQRFAISLALTSALASCALASFEEYLQLYVPNRFFDWRDIILNATSSLFGATLGYLALKKD